jgi:multicomponent K+:H+ antiporter subunit C
MELLLAIGIGVLFAGGVWLLLRAHVFPVLLGLTLLSYAVNLLLIASGRVTVDSAPLVEAGRSLYPDPLPQALVLTAIVIGFAMTAVLVALALRAYGTERAEHVDGAPGAVRDEAGDEPDRARAEADAATDEPAGARPDGARDAAASPGPRA